MQNAESDPKSFTKITESLYFNNYDPSLLDYISKMQGGEIKDTLMSQAVNGLQYNYRNNNLQDVKKEDRMTTRRNGKTP